jgi:hypothetical protein
VVPRRIGIRTIVAIRNNNLNLCDIEGIPKDYGATFMPRPKRHSELKNAERLRDIIKPLDRLPILLINVFDNFVNKNSAKCSTLL